MKPRVARLCLLLLTAFTTAQAEPGAPFTDDPEWLVRDGVFRGKIFVAEGADSVEREAAAHLADWIRRVTGAPVEVAVEPPTGVAPGIHLGATRRAREAGLRVTGLASREGFAWAPGARGELLIVGETPLATRLAAGRFIAERLGVEFLLPGEFGAEWTPRRRLALPESRRDFRPAFDWRNLTGMRTPAEKIWALDNGLGGMPASGHALWEVFDDAAFAENPGMFPMSGGVITGPSGLRGYEPQPNLANPDSARHAARRARAFFQKNPQAPTFSLSINDNMTWDDSPESKAARGAGKYFRNLPDYSDYVFGFMNRAAEALRAEEASGSIEGKGKGASDFSSPRLLTGYAYYHCENTPSFPVHPGVFPILTADRSEWRDPGFAAEDAALITRWSKSGAGMFGVYDYYYGINMAVPRIFHAAQAASMKHAAKSGARLFYAELEPDWGFDGPKAWLAAKLARDPAADAEASLSAYYDSAYGPAAGAMRRFYEVAESRWTNRDQAPRWIRFFREESVAELFPASVCATMRAALDEAERAFGPATPSGARDAGREERRRLRVRAVSVSFAKAEAFVARYEAMKRLDALPEARDDAGVARITGAFAEWRAADARYREAVSRWNDSALNPGMPFRTEVYWSTDLSGMAASKCAPMWRDLDVFSGISRRAAACFAETPPDGAETLVAESFEEDAFRPPLPGGWGVAKGLTIPKSPWTVNLFEAERTRFGRSVERAATGKSSLIIAGGDLAKLSRTVPISFWDTLSVSLRHSGRVVPGEHIALSIRFLDADGGELYGGSRAMALPGGDDGWRTLAVTAVAPVTAESAEIVLRVMCQTVEDALWVDDLRVRRCASDLPIK